jgi:hypothetical protein
MGGRFVNLMDISITRSNGFKSLHKLIVLLELYAELKMLICMALRNKTIF